MRIEDVPFTTTNWSAIRATEHAGASGVATWRTATSGFEWLSTAPAIWPTTGAAEATFFSCWTES
jgi:hypothetical protein